MHNDYAVLENHHAMTLMCLLRLPNCDLTAEMSKVRACACVFLMRWL